MKRFRALLALTSTVVVLFLLGGCSFFENFGAVTRLRHPNFGGDWTFFENYGLSQMEINLPGLSAFGTRARVLRLNAEFEDGVLGRTLWLSNFGNHGDARGRDGEYRFVPHELYGFGTPDIIVTVFGEIRTDFRDADGYLLTRITPNPGNVVLRRNLSNFVVFTYSINASSAINFTASVTGTRP